MSAGRVALPLLAALARDLDPSGHGAVGAGQPHVHGAEGHAAHGSVQAGALVLAAALEGLAALVHHASEHAGGALASCTDKKHGVEPKILSKDTELWSDQTRSRLTCAHPNASVDGGAKVAVQALVRVAHVLLRAQLAHLLGAHPAAAAAVQHQAHPRGALGGCGRARALVAALLSCSLREREENTRKERERVKMCLAEDQSQIVNGWKGRRCRLSPDSPCARG